MCSAILIYSADSDFATILAEQVQQELEIDCCALSDKTKIKAKIAAYSLLVSDEPFPDMGCPLVAVGPKPIHLSGLLSHIRFALRQLHLPDTLGLSLGHMLDCRHKQILHEASGNKTNITDKELELLLALSDAPASGMSKEDLLHQVWGIDEMIDTHTLQTHIYRLRNKLRDLSGADQMILAVGSNYKLASDE